MNLYDVKAGLAEIDAFDVIGISVVTDKNRATEDINALWERFFKESIGQFVSNKINDNIYAVYSNYEGDHEKPYRLTIGYRVSDVHIPANMTHVRVQGGDYALLSAAGEQPKALIGTWEAIWSSDLPRLFKTDFELYGPRFFQEGVHEVFIHVGIKDRPTPDSRPVI